MASNEVRGITSRFQVHQASGVCKTSTTVSLLLLSLWVPPAVCSLICGSSIFRRRLSRIKNQPEEHAGYVNRFYLFVSLFGSFFFQAVVFAIAQAQLLADSNPDNSFSDLYWVWLIRPLPATFVLFMAYMCPTLYLESALEMQCVEGVFGMFTIGIYDDIRKGVRGADILQPGVKHIRDGANLGFAFWILSFFVALAVVALLKIGMLRHRPPDNTPIGGTPLRLWTGWSIIFNMMRMIAGFLIWAGIAQVDQQVFCLSLAATGGIAAIAFASALVDHGWRAYFCVLEGTTMGPLSSVFR
ncbi:hypothetical protein A1O7_08977 [Cladophialophora yegresii CBS 114405]|uniref:Uncharacterized protein n=1 Tax=Cladophialophora yegresii CBS 114405 TaxID=1182544 RepID=W9VV57_9EURO|nr:uncharacterized protein A1O7_08977 [Cladophialophora yegresii CBS 114405]EXJ56046.1 hypothetical protein A1O7_08977 [Cladophialophora yegresii CBS 114405]